MRRKDGSSAVFISGGGSDVTGPVGATADDVATFNGTTGTLIKDSGVAISNLPKLNALNTFTMKQTISAAVALALTNAAAEIDFGATADVKLARNGAASLGLTGSLGATGLLAAGGSSGLFGYDADAVAVGAAVSLFDGISAYVVLKALGANSLGTGTSDKLSAYGFDARSQKLTSVANGSASDDGAAFGQIATAIAALSSVYQPLDSDLTAIAALATTSYGRSLLTVANAAAAQTLLGLVIGTNVQAWDADLDALAGLTSAANKIPMFSGSHTATLLGLDTDGTLAANLDTNVPSQKAAKTYVDARFPASATADDIATFNGVTGKIIKDSTVPVAQVPSANEKAALAGTDGTPSATDKFVTDSDLRINQTALTLAQAILTLKPSMYLTLGSGGAGLTDQSGNGRNGTGAGAITIGGGTSLNSASAGSTSFNGTANKITTTYAPFATGSQRTFMGWATVATLAGSFNVFGGLGANAPGLTANDSLNGATWLTATGANAGWTGSWPTLLTVFWALTYDDSAHTAELFINGTSRGVVSTTSGYVTPGNLQIGQGHNTFFWSGLQSDFVVYERLLSPGAISWLYRIGTGHGKDWGIVNALPTGALYGDTCVYIAANNTNGGVYWNLIYDGQGSFPWKVVGGPPLWSEVVTAESRTTASYGALTTAGPSITVPLAGDYDVSVGSMVEMSTAGHIGFMSYDIGATGAVDADGLETISRSANEEWPPGIRKRRKTSLAASTALVAKYKPDGTAVTWEMRTMEAKPIRVG